mmetsp:Transcript_71703/g.184944  ORF Transcript_71703/g.184944 Transcript_71703/m.184944 type:complete len:286 (+) Transcript_71703:548-1405(+)
MAGAVPRRRPAAGELAQADGVGARGGRLRRVVRERGHGRGRRGAADLRRVRAARALRAARAHRREQRRGRRGLGAPHARGEQRRGAQAAARLDGATPRHGLGLRVLPLLHHGRLCLDLPQRLPHLPRTRRRPAAELRCLPCRVRARRAQPPRGRHRDPVRAAGALGAVRAQAQAAAGLRAGEQREAAELRAPAPIGQPRRGCRDRRVRGACHRCSGRGTGRCRYRQQRWRQCRSRRACRAVGGRRGGALCAFFRSPPRRCGAGGQHGFLACGSCIGLERSRRYGP